MISKPKKPKLNPVLLAVILISLGLHLLALVVFGSYTLVKMVLPDEAEFEEPPAVEEIEPPPDVKVEIKPQAAPQQQEMQDLRMQQVGNISVAAVDVDLPSMEQSFTVSSGLGGFGGGSLLGNTRGNIGLGVSEVNVFGLKTRAERILFAVDASKHMLVDEKGGLNSYRAIKKEITTMVENLSTGTLFNVVFFDDGKLLFFKPNPVPAGTEVAAELKRWIQPVNADIESLGLPGASRRDLKILPDHPIHDAIQHYHHRGHNEMMYLTQVFLEQAIDAAYVITGNHPGFGRVRRRPTTEEREEWRETIRDRGYQEDLKAWRAVRAEAVKKAREKLQRVNEARKKKGIPPKVITDTDHLLREMGVKVEAKHPGHAPNHYIDQRDVERYIDDVVETIYEDNGGEPPSMNVILFLAGDEELRENKEDALDDYVREFSGDYRVLRGLDEIEDSASAAETRN